GFLPFAPAWGQSPVAFTARAGLRIEDVTIFLIPAIDYQGKVVDPQGRPVAGAHVMLLGARTGEQTLEPLADSFLSDKDGEFQFHARDGAFLEAPHPRYSRGRAVLDGAVATSHRLTIRLGAAGEGSIGTAQLAGRVTDGAGRPLEGASVRGVYQPEPGRARDPHPPLDAMTDARG